MTDRKLPLSSGTQKKSEETKPKTAALSPGDLDQVSGGINPQPLPPGKTRAPQ